MTGLALDARVKVDRGSGFVLDAALAAAPGEVVAVMGPSGAGKSTLLSAIAGLVHLSGGSVRIGDREVASASPRRHDAPARRRAALLGQDPLLFPHMTARQNVAFALRARGIDRSVASSEADEWLWRVGLPGSGHHKPRELSGGQQQRVALARALGAAPGVLLLDEPLTALDAQTAGEIRTVVHDQLAAAHATAVIVTHDAVDAAALATRLVLLEGGRVTQEGAVLEVLGAPATDFAATIAGVNRVVGIADGGLWRSRDASPMVRWMARDAASRAAVAREGERVAAVFRPTAVRLSEAVDSSWTAAVRLAIEAPTEPGSWVARVVRIEQTPGGARVHTAEPAVSVEVGAEVIASLGLHPGMPVRLRLDPADVRFQPAP